MSKKTRGGSNQRPRRSQPKIVQITALGLVGLLIISIIAASFSLPV